MFLLLELLLSSPAFSASFNCSGQLSQVEKVICEHPAISAQDDLLSENYRKLSSAYTDNDQVYLRRDQVAWIKDRNQCGVREDVVFCLITNYRERNLLLRNFSSLLSSDVLEEAGCDPQIITVDQGNQRICIPVYLEYRRFFDEVLHPYLMNRYSQIGWLKENHDLQQYTEYYCRQVSEVKSFYTLTKCMNQIFSIYLEEFSYELLSENLNNNFIESKPLQKSSETLSADSLDPPLVALLTRRACHGAPLKVNQAFRMRDARSESVTWIDFDCLSYGSSAYISAVQYVGDGEYRIFDIGQGKNEVSLHYWDGCYRGPCDEEASEKQHLLNFNIRDFDVDGTAEVYVAASASGHPRFVWQYISHLKEYQIIPARVSHNLPAGIGQFAIYSSSDRFGSMQARDAYPINPLFFEPRIQSESQARSVNLKNYIWIDSLLPRSRVREATSAEPISVHNKIMLSEDGEKVLFEDYLFDAGKNQVRRLREICGSEGSGRAYVLSEDGAKVSYLKYQQYEGDHVFQCDLKAGVEERMFDGVYLGVRELASSRNGAVVAFITDNRKGPRVLKVFIRGMAEPRSVHQRANLAVVSGDGQWVLYSAHDARWKDGVFLYSVRNEKSVKISDVRASDIAISYSGEYAFVLSDERKSHPQHPAGIYSAIDNKWDHFPGPESSRNPLFKFIKNGGEFIYSLRDADTFGYALYSRPMFNGGIKKIIDIDGHSVAISDDERHVAFLSASPSHVYGDQNEAADVFYMDLTDGKIRRISYHQDESVKSAIWTDLSAAAHSKVRDINSKFAGELYGLEFNEWDPHGQTLRFYNEAGRDISYTAQLIGTYDHTLKVWSWDQYPKNNPNFIAVRDMLSEEGLADYFSYPSLKCTEVEAWEMASIFGERESPRALYRLVRDKTSYYLMLK